MYKKRWLFHGNKAWKIRRLKNPMDPSPGSLAELDDGKVWSKMKPLEIQQKNPCFPADVPVPVIS
jgi:hypothetical protein